MSTQDSEKQEVQDMEQEENIDSSPEFALLFELENIVVEGRSAIFNVLNSILTEQGTELSQANFSRYCTCSVPSRYMADLLVTLGTKKLSADKTIEDLDSGLAMFYSSNDLALKDGVLAFLKAAKKRGVALGAVSGLPKEMAASVLKKTGLSDLEVEMVSFNGTAAASPRADTWMMMAKAMSIGTRQCVAIGSSSLACKAALSAGMRSVAIPDPFTDFQDFGGAEIIDGSLADINVSKVLNSFFPENLT